MTVTVARLKKDAKAAGFRPAQYNKLKKNDLLILLLPYQPIPKPRFVKGKRPPRTSSRVKNTSTYNYKDLLVYWKKPSVAKYVASIMSVVSMEVIDTIGNLSKRPGMSQLSEVQKLKRLLKRIVNC